MNKDDRDPALMTIADRIGALITTEMQTNTNPDPITILFIVTNGDHFEIITDGCAKEPQYDALADAMNEVCCNWAECGLIDIDADDETDTPTNGPIQ